MSFGRMNDLELTSIDVRQLLPQRPPFVMIDQLLHFDMAVTTTRFEVRADNLFMEGTTLNPCALVENIAQTCAARMGYINQYVVREKVKLGFIGSIRDLQILRPVHVGDVLETTIEVKEEIMRVTLVQAVVKAGGETIVTADMKIALSDIDAAE